MKNYLLKKYILRDFPWKYIKNDNVVVRKLLSHITTEKWTQFSQSGTRPQLSLTGNTNIWSKWLTFGYCRGNVTRVET